MEETRAGNGADWFTRPAEAENQRKSETVLRLNAYLSGTLQPCLHYTRSAPDWVHGEVWVVRSLPVQGYYGVVAVVNEDVGAALDEGNRRARYHLHSHTVVTVHHTARHLHLHSNGDWSLSSVYLGAGYRVPGPGLRVHVGDFLFATYPSDGSIRVIVQEMAGQHEVLSVCVYKRQREDPPCRVKQGPGVMKASGNVTVNFRLIGHSQMDNLMSSHLEVRRCIK